MKRTSVTGIETTLRTAAERFHDVALVVLFGSAVSGRLRNDSDVDIAIAGKVPFSWERLQEIRTALSKALHREIDLIDLNASEGMIRHQALTKGTVVIVKNRRLMARLMTDIVYFAADMLPLMTMVFKRRARRFING